MQTDPSHAGVLGAGALEDPATTGFAQVASRRHILVVDDESRMLGLLLRVMRANGFEVRCASHAARGYELLDGSCSLVLLDLMMPGENGFGLLERIRDAFPEIPVIVLSAISDVDAKVRCFELGATDYVTKPFAMAELLARIRRAQARSCTEEQRWLGDGHLRLDLHRHEVVVDDRIVALSTRECALLTHLMRRAGHVCTRPELLERVWGCSFDPGTNVVDVYVRRLRTKLGDRVVDTVRSVGYSYGLR
jgi:two-component system OmpR family response regulator